MRRIVNRFGEVADVYDEDEDIPDRLVDREREAARRQLAASLARAAHVGLDRATQLADQVVPTTDEGLRQAEVRAAAAQAGRERSTAQRAALAEATRRSAEARAERARAAAAAVEANRAAEAERFYQRARAARAAERSNDYGEAAGL